MRQHYEATCERGLRPALLPVNVARSPSSCGIHPHKEQAVQMLRKATELDPIRKREPFAVPA